MKESLLKKKKTVFERNIPDKELEKLSGAIKDSNENGNYRVAMEALAGICRKAA